MTKTAVFVGAVVQRDDKVLLVRQAAGHPLAGQWTVPWGRVEDGESPVAAAVRETREEGGVLVTVDGLLGVQDYRSRRTGASRSFTYARTSAAYLNRVTEKRTPLAIAPCSAWTT